MSSDEYVDGEGWLSDESEFYGNSRQQSQWESRLRQPDLDEYLSETHLNLNHLAAINLAKKAAAPPSPSKEPYNPFEGQRTGRQLSETVPEFLSRLPPSKTRQSDAEPWIWISNPYLPRGAVPDSADVPAFTAAAETILNELDAAARDAAEQPLRAGKAAVDAAVAKFRVEAERKLLAAAKKYEVKSGKWMLFPIRRDVDRIWGTVAEAMGRGQLGHVAKVAAECDQGDRVGRPVCVYTHDFGNREDVKRVLLKLVELDLVPKRGEVRMVYKTDAWTHAGIKMNNAWGIKASTYSSVDLLKKK